MRWKLPCHHRRSTYARPRLPTRVRRTSEPVPATPPPQAHFGRLRETQIGPGGFRSAGADPQLAGPISRRRPVIVTDPTGHWSPFELGATASEQNRCCTAEDEQAPGRETGEFCTGARHRVTTGAPGLARVRAASGFVSGDDELPVHADVQAVRLDLVGPYVSLGVVGEAVDLHSGRSLIIAAGRLRVELRVEVLGPDLELHLGLGLAG